MTEHISVRRGVYHDSVTLLRISQAAASVPGITAAQVAMATPLNSELAADLGFSSPDGAGPNDLMITIRGQDDGAVAAALAAVDAAMTAPAGSGSPGTVRGTPHRPGRRGGASGSTDHAALGSGTSSARRGSGRDRRRPARDDLFRQCADRATSSPSRSRPPRPVSWCMGPDCGTAIIGGVGLGFANVLQHTRRRPAGRRRRRLRNRCAAVDLPAGRGRGCRLPGARGRRS